uniref:Variant surface glycoprotein 1125.383 n=1 Tax=Trypanosoma brucei TaxID=5691 RepID=A0A1J0R5S3_9TRYP|nr:variant surface glycoprotein 1125.383 [Trypanosoma brucei]
MRTITAAVFTVTHAIIQMASTADENSAAFKAICTAYLTAAVKLQRTDVTLEGPPDQPTVIQNLNLLTLHSSNFTNKTYLTYDTVQKWSEKKAEFAGAQSKTADGDYVVKPDSEAKAVGHNRLARILKHANNVYQTAQDANNQLNQRITDVNNHLTSAIYGINKTDDNSEAPYDTRQNACAAAGNAIGKSLLSEMVCICSGSSAASVCCTTCGNALYTNAVNNNPNNAKTAAAITLAICKKKPKPKLSVATIASSVNLWLSTIGNKQTDTNGYLRLGGGATAVNCEGGSDANTACTDYTTVLASGDITKVPWVKRLLQAEAALIQADKEAAVLTAAKTTLSQLTIQAWTVYDSIPSTSIDAKPTQAQKTTTGHQIECDKHTAKTAAECKSLGCDHDEKENKCKPKPGAETAAAGTGEGGSDPNRSQYTDTEKCKKVPGKPKNGKKAVCGWIEGKFQDSSFLVDKQFALMFSAFVALLF